VDENTDLTSLVFSTRAQMRDAAILKFDDVINNLTTTTFTVPGDFFGKPGQSYDNVAIAQIANTMAARTLAYYPRTAAENADVGAGGQVNWATVESYAQNGISSGAAPFDWVFHQDGCINWCDFFKVWSNDLTTMRMHTRIARLLDPVSQEDPWPVDNPNTTLAAPITANAAPQAATPVSMTNIATGRQLTVGGSGRVIDTLSVGPPVVTDTVRFDDKEKVVVTGTTGTTFTGVFSKDHPSTTLTVAITKSATPQDATPASMAGIVKGHLLSIDTTSSLNTVETVTVLSVTATTFSARFGKDHPVGSVVGSPVHRNGGSPGNDNPNSPDARLGDGTLRPERAGDAFAAAFSMHPDTSGNGGTDYTWTFDEEIQRKTRGSWHQSSIGQVRYDSLASCGDNPEGLPTGVGDTPVVLAAESDLIWAEAELRKPGGSAATAAMHINKTRQGRGNLPASAGTLADLQYEQDVELAGSNGFAPFFNQRRIDNLEPGTPHEMPIPAKELGVLQKPLYTWGGFCATCQPNSSPTAPAPGVAAALVLNAQQRWAELEHQMLMGVSSGRGFHK